LLFRSQQRLAAQHEIDQHIQRGLFETIQDEKKRRRRGKRLNLVGEETGSAELWNTAKIEQAKGLVLEKTTKALQEKEDKVQGKVIKAKEKLEQAMEAHKSRVKKTKNARIKHLIQEAEKERKALAKLDSKKPFILVLQYKKPASHSAKAVHFVIDPKIIVEEEGSKTRVTRTRVISMPARYKK